MNVPSKRQWACLTLLERKTLSLDVLHSLPLVEVASKRQWAGRSIHRCSAKNRPAAQSLGPHTDHIRFGTGVTALERLHPSMTAIMSLCETGQTSTTSTVFTVLYHS